MKESKLIKRLSKLGEMEIKDFSKFVRSPYFNSNKGLIKLLDSLILFYPKFDHRRLNKRVVFDLIYPGSKPYNEGRMSLLMTQLVALLNHFFAFETFKGDELLIEKTRAKAFKNRQLDKPFFTKVKKLSTTIASLQQKEQSHLESFLLNKEVYTHVNSQAYNLNKTSFENSLKHLDLFYLWEKMTFAVIAKNRNRLLGEKHDFLLLETLMKNFDAEIEASPVLKFYRQLLILMDSEAEILLKKLSEGLEEILPKLSKEEKQICIVILLNMTADKYRKGEIYLGNTLFDLYKKGLSLDLFLENEIMQEVIFINIVSIASACGAFDWTRDFIEKYKENLNPKVKADAEKLAMAFLFYHEANRTKEKEKFDVVIEFLMDIKFNKPFHFYRAKTLLLRAYYECYLDNKKSQTLYFVLDQANAFEVQLRRKEETLGLKMRPFLNFVLESKKLARLKFDDTRTTQQVQSFHERLSKNKSLFSKQWLLEKIGELE